MRSSLLIIGGGHAGVSAALGAARLLHLLKSNIQIHLISDRENLTIRPRLYEHELAQTQIPLKTILEPIGVNIIIDKIASIDFNHQFAIGQSNQYFFENIILAAGSCLANNAIPGISKFCHSVDTFDSATLFHQSFTHLIKNAKPDQCYRVVILGGGLTGIECATELPLTIEKICHEYHIKKPSVEIVLIDRNDITTNLGENPQSVIDEALKYCGIKCIHHATILAIENNKVILSNHTLPADMIISTLGMVANSLTHHLPFSKGHLGRIHVNSYLQAIDQPNCFAAGDIAVTKVDEEHASIMSCQQARPQGRYAGYNSIAKLLNQPLLTYKQPHYVTCLDLGKYGALYTEGWDRVVKKAGQTTKKIKQYINQERIYPTIPMTLEALMIEGAPEPTPISSVRLSNG